MGIPEPYETAPMAIPEERTSTESGSGLDWVGPGVAVLFNARSFEEEGSELVLGDEEGGEVIRLPMDHVLQWSVLSG